ncbi:stage 0 sporulation protein [bacterium]|nr:stage 0 sporulation protein [bacterium]
MRHVGVFRTDLDKLRSNEKCILRTDRGVELGEIVTPDDQPRSGKRKAVLGQILRRATPRDLSRAEEIEEQFASQERSFCQGKIREHALPMKLASVEHLFGGDKIIFYFLAEGRVDFRALVKDLAAQYRTRIEMRQIGVRDEARLLADVEHCGCELCCKRFMKDLAPVTMRMAKAQKTTLDPAKISGRCGRLMCCLGFEDATYRALREELPKRGARVGTPQGVGIVAGFHILKQTVTVDVQGKGEQTFSVKELEPPPPLPKREPEDKDAPEGQKPEPEKEPEDRAAPEGQEPEPEKEPEPDAQANEQQKPAGD